MSRGFIDPALRRVLRRTDKVYISPDTPNGDTLVAFIGAEAWRAARAQCDDDLPSLKRLVEHYIVPWNAELFIRLGVPLPRAMVELIAREPEWVMQAVRRKCSLFADDPRLFVDAKVLRASDDEVEVHALAACFSDPGSQPRRSIVAEPPRTVAPRTARRRDESSRQRRKRQKEARRRQRG